MNKTQVHIIGPTFGLEHIFPRYGYTPWVDSNYRSAPSIDIACFTGGADISPGIYGEIKLPCTSPIPSRDAVEIGYYKKYKKLPKLGVCRGAQLINALNGGGMYQDVDKHNNGSHPIITQDGTIIVSSVHHQLMIPAPNAEIIAWTAISTYRINDKGRIPRREGEIDPEVIWIEEDKALCFQGHPEFGPKSCTDYFFRLVDQFIQKEST